jgi:hypothetical protein
MLVLAAPTTSGARSASGKLFGDPPTPSFHAASRMLLAIAR